MKRKLTWKRAWLKLHRWFLRNEGLIGGLSVSICEALAFVSSKGSWCRKKPVCGIPWDLAISMARVAKRRPRAEFSGYRWRIDNWNARAAFCLRMSKTKEPK